MKAEAPTFEAINLLGLILEKTGSAEEKDLLLTAVEALRFIETTGQQYDFEDYRQALRTEGPEMVLASFATREEAEAWLKNHPKPPRRAAVLIADEYHSVYYWRDTHFRKLTSSPTLAFYLEEMMKDAAGMHDIFTPLRQAMEEWGPIAEPQAAT